MRMHHSFELPGSVDRAWQLLNRIDEIAPCLPGASVTKAGEGQFNGNMRVRMGPLDMTFKGTIAIVERDAAAGRVVLRSKGSEARGQGTASATTVANLSQQGDCTRVSLDTDLMISGRVAQMGRGMVVEISNDLIDRFVTNLKTELAGASAAASVKAPAARDRGMVGAGVMQAPAAGTERVGEQSLNVAALLWRVLSRKVLRLLGLLRQT